MGSIEGHVPPWTRREKTGVLATAYMYSLDSETEEMECRSSKSHVI